MPGRVGGRTTHSGGAAPPTVGAGGPSRGAARRAARRDAARRRRWLPIAAAAIVAIGLVGGLIWLGQGRATAPPPVTAPTQGTVMGDPSAPITVEEFGDFQCPACRAYALGDGRRLEETLIASGQAKLVWHNLAFIGPESFAAAEAATCAADQGKFWQYHHTLYAEQGGENSGAFSTARLKRFADEVGLDRAQFDACVDGGTHRTQVQDEARAAQQRGVTSTPTLFVNGRKVVGGASVEQIQQLAGAAGSPASGG